MHAALSQRGNRVAPNRLVFVALRVRDLAASVQFYREAFKIELEPGQPPERHAEISWPEGAYVHFALFPSGERAEHDPRGVDRLFSRRLRSSP